MRRLVDHQFTPHTDPLRADWRTCAVCGFGAGIGAHMAAAPTPHTATPASPGGGIPSAPRRTGVGAAPTARHADPATSHQAATVARRRLRADVFLALDAHVRAGEQGLTGDELARATGRPYESIGPRRPALEAAGWLAKAGKRPNDKGNPTQVYVATAAGIDAWRAHATAA